MRSPTPVFIILLLAVSGCEPGSSSAPAPVIPHPTQVTTPTKNTTPKTPTTVEKTKAEIEAEQWIPGEKREKLYLDFDMEDQDGKPYSLKSIKGKPTVATFIFTRCPNPAMCPLQGAKMAEIQKSLEKQGLGDKVNILIISFDPDYDTPARLKKFAQQAGFNVTTGKALRPNPREFQEFRHVFQFRIGYGEDGQLTHKTDLMLIDAQGRLARQYAGMWEDEQAIADVMRLLDEMKETAPAATPGS